jgi:hypothetical protein
MTSAEIRSAVARALETTPVLDMHTHTFQPSFGGLGLWGIDQLLTYHYLEAELFRSFVITPEAYWKLSKSEQADLIWETLFVRQTPISEATRGVIAVLAAFGLPTSAPDLKQAREFFEAQTIDQHVDNVFRLAGVSEVVMTNDPLDPAEAPCWLNDYRRDPRFHAALRLDRILTKWPLHWEVLRAQGYDVDGSGGGAKTISEVRRFLAGWMERMAPRYAAVSLPDTFLVPEDSQRARILTEAVLPCCREYGIPMALMIGVRYLVNPGLRLAGDAVGRADLRALEYLCREFPDNRFLVTVLSRENQHELCTYARKFPNLLPFGCWWFLNNPSIVEEMTRERIEMLGQTFVPQHSDARILEQIIYKWRFSRRVIGEVLSNAYTLLEADGRAVTGEEIERDVRRLMRGNFEQWTTRASTQAAS